MDHYASMAGNRRERRWHVSALRSLTHGVDMIYAVQLPDRTIKIGWSADLAQRRWSVSSGTEILGFMPGTYEDEQSIHATLRPHRAHGREYYHPTAAVLAVVNEMRDRFNLPHVAA